MNTDSYARKWPHLFHVTNSANLASIERTHRLMPAAALLGPDAIAATSPRLSEVPAEQGGLLVRVRDQQPLHVGAIDFEEGWTLQRLVGELNARVFFWPGGDLPNRYGQNHFGRYASRGEPLVVLRARFDDVCAANPGVGPEGCRFNSGAPRCAHGKRSPRGASTFVPMERWSLPPSRVAEVSFRGAVALPRSIEASHGSFRGPWAAVWL